MGRSDPAFLRDGMSTVSPWSARRRRPSASRTPALDARRTSDGARNSTSNRHMGPAAGQGLDRVAERDGVLAPELQTDVIRGVHVPDGALGEEPVLGRPNGASDWDRRARRLFDTSTGPDPARGDAGALG